MDIGKLKRNSLQVWLPLIEGVEVLCRHLSQSAFDAITRDCKTIKLNPATQVKTEEIDEAKFRSAMARAVVVDWRGLEEDGAPWPCTPKNIDYLMEECTEFRLLVRGAPLSLGRMLAAEKEATAKNSETTSAPASITQG